MVVGCTKKLLDYLEIKPQKPTVTADPLFSWTANLILLNRRKTIVVMNNATKCCFVLHGVTQKSISKMPELILSGIRAMLESEYIAPSVIEQYLSDCGNEITFSSPVSRSEIAYCNKACARVERFTNLFDPGDMMQTKYLPWINDDLNAKENYAFLYDTLINTLSKRYGKPVQSAHVAELEVTLNLLTPCKRVLRVPSNINFYQLHRILQCSFEWEDCHLHQFVVSRDRRRMPEKIIQPAHMQNFDSIFDFGIEMIDSTEVTVRQIFEAQKKIEYEYDFGDDWNHTIKLKKFIPNCETPYPHCTDAIGDAPMEDSGGPYGFFDKMQILNDPKHPDHQWISEWMRGSLWNPIDLNRINNRIRDEHRRCIPVIYD